MSFSICKNRRMEDENIFETKDFYLSAFLLARGYKLISVNRDDPQRVLFAFNDFEDREELLRDFLYSKSSIEPQAFINSIKALKQVLHSND